MSNTKNREEQLEQLKDLIVAQDAEMHSLHAHAAKLSAEGVELSVGSLPAELDALVERTVQKFRPVTNITINYGLKA